MPYTFNQKILNHTKKFDHVIWDWNGTLINDIEIAVESVNVLLCENNLPAVSIDNYKNLFGFPIRSYYERIGFDLSQLSFEKLCQRFAEEYNDKRAHTANLFAGLPDLLMEIKKTKTQSILSAAEQDHLHTMTKHFGLENHFHNRFGIADFYAASKIERGHELISLSGIEPKKSILIGDTDHDYEVASALGVSCLLIADGHQSEHRLKQLCENVISRSSH